ncbi:hypothetical protein ACHAWF_001790 [Thalassiosira exigua]
MKMSVKLIPQKIMDQYNLHDKTKNGQVWMMIKKGMYGLPQSGIWANKFLKESLAKGGYFELPHTPGLWKHESRPISFSLVIDNFGIKYTRKEDVGHLLAAIGKNYPMSADWKGELYCGIMRGWNYDRGYVDISMPKYVQKQLAK